MSVKWSLESDLEWEGNPLSGMGDKKMVFVVLVLGYAGKHTEKSS